VPRPAYKGCTGFGASVGVDGPAHPASAEIQRAANSKRGFDFRQASGAFLSIFCLL
jgi:hypothetical protein